MVSLNFQAFFLLFLFLPPPPPPPSCLVSQLERSGDHLKDEILRSLRDLAGSHIPSSRMVHTGCFRSWHTCPRHESRFWCVCFVVFFVCLLLFYIYSRVMECMRTHTGPCLIFSSEKVTPPPPLPLHPGRRNRVNDRQ